MLFYKKSTALRSKKPTITELVKEPPLWKNSERHPEVVVEFEDGASDVLLSNVPFLPALHSPQKK